MNEREACIIYLYSFMCRGFFTLNHRTGWYKPAISAFFRWRSSPPCYAFDRFWIPFANGNKTESNPNLLTAWNLLSRWTFFLLCSYQSTVRYSPSINKFDSICLQGTVAASRQLCCSELDFPCTKRISDVAMWICMHFAVSRPFTAFYDLVRTSHQNPLLLWPDTNPRNVNLEAVRSQIHRALVTLWPMNSVGKHRTRIQVCCDCYY